MCGGEVGVGCLCGVGVCCVVVCCFVFFQAEDGIRDLVRSRGLGDVYKRQVFNSGMAAISSIFFTFTKPGRTTLFSSPIYGGTHHLIHEMLIPTGYNLSLIHI